MAQRFVMGGTKTELTTRRQVALSGPPGALAMLGAQRSQRSLRNGLSVNFHDSLLDSLAAF
jgi:hypothetical protein